MMETLTIGPTALLSAGALFNLLLVISLHRTWRYWNQMKWYLLMLTVGNCLEVLFTLSTLLGSTFHESWLGGDLSCKFLMFMNPLGPNLANMALAASAVHVLLTAITRSHGNRLRHILVLGLFVLLSLPLPVSKIPIFSVVSERTVDSVVDTCTDLGFFHDADPHYRFYYFVAGSIALLFFPLVVIVGALGGAVMVNYMGARDTTRKRERVHEEHRVRDNGPTASAEDMGAESNTAEVTLTIILGTALMLLCVPLHIFIIFFRHPQSIHNTVMVYTILMYMFYSKVSITAFVCVIYACVHVYRTGRQLQAQEWRKAGERKKLVD